MGYLPMGVLRQIGSLSVIRRVGKQGTQSPTVWENYVLIHCHARESGHLLTHIEIPVFTGMTIIYRNDNHLQECILDVCFYMVQNKNILHPNDSLDVKKYQINS